MEQIFLVVYSLLHQVSRSSGLSYAEINVIVYYFAIPFVYALLLDIWRGFHWAKIAATSLILLAIVVFSPFREFSDSLFQASVEFLRFFAYLQIDYIQASVFFCVAVPLAAGVVLAGLAWRGYRARHFTEAILEA